MEFLGAAFSPINEKEHLVTLSGSPDWEVILWKWDTFKLLARIKLNVTVPECDSRSFSISFQKASGTDTKVVVTGEQTYAFMTLKSEQNTHSFELLQDELQAVSPDGHMVSKNYTCHTWTKDPAAMFLLVGTAEGDMLICDFQGLFKVYVEDSPSG